MQWHMVCVQGRDSAGPYVYIIISTIAQVVSPFTITAQANKIDLSHGMG